MMPAQGLAAVILLGAVALAACGRGSDLAPDGGAGNADSRDAPPNLASDGGPGNADSRDAPSDSPWDDGGICGFGWLPHAAPADAAAGPTGPSGVACGAVTCAVGTQECCTGSGAPACVALGACQVGYALRCDGPEDCAGSQGGCELSDAYALGPSPIPTASCGGSGLTLPGLATSCLYAATCEYRAGEVVIRYCDMQCVDRPWPGVECTGGSCTAGQVCCVGQTQALLGTCTAPEACTAAAFACDGAEDCGGATPECCATSAATGSRCVAAGACTPSDASGGVLCHTAADCAGVPGAALCQRPPVGNPAYAVCQAPRDCGDGSCAPTVTLAGSQDTPHALAVDATHAYWATLRGVSRVPRAGGTPEELASVTDFVYGIAVDSTHAYFSTGPAAGVTGGGALMRVPLAGGATETLAALDAAPWSFILDASGLYWLGGTVGALAILTLPLAGGAPTAVAPAAGAWWIDGPVLDPTSIYFAVQVQPGVCEIAIQKVPRAGGSPVTLAAGLPYVSQLSVDATGLWFRAADQTGPAGAWLMRLPVDGGEPSAVVASPYPAWFALTDPGRVYWTTGCQGGSIMAAARSDWIPTPLALGEQCPDEIVIADGQVFWIAGNSPYGQVKTLR